MKSQWFEYKDAAVALRHTGMSIKAIEAKLGIPRSTLSGWFKGVELTEEQLKALEKNKRDAWAKARLRAAESHREAKRNRLESAKIEAQETLGKLKISTELLDLAFAMLYLGEGAKGNASSIGNSDPKVLRFAIHVLKMNYGLTRETIRCELHLRADQNTEVIKKYWAEELDLPITSFRYTVIDKRTIGKPTYPGYKGVCVVVCGGIAIQRKLICLYNEFCDKVTESYSSEGA